MIWYDMMWSDVWFAPENWQVSWQFNLAHELERTENVLNVTEMREVEQGLFFNKSNDHDTDSLWNI